MQHMTKDEFYKANVKRWHASQSAGLRHCGDNITQHQMRCVDYVRDLVRAPSENLIRATRWHDQAEVILGDLPFTAKRDWPELAQAFTVAEAAVNARYDVPTPADEWQARVIKFVDRLDAAITCKQYDPKLYAESIDWERARDWLGIAADMLDFDLEHVIAFIKP